MYRITAPNAKSDAVRRAPAPELRLVLAVLAVAALAMLAYYVHVLQDQVLRAQQFRAQWQQSGTTVAAAKSPGRAARLVAARQ